MRLGPRSALLLALVGLLSARAAGQGLEPLEAREGWLLLGSRLSLPSAHPRGLGRGETELRLDGVWGSDFGWRGRWVDGRPRDVRFLVDGEHRAATLQVRHGLTPRLTVGLRTGVLWRGGGALDGVIDWWHRALHLPDNGRPLFPRDRLRVEGEDLEGRPIAWAGEQGTGLGATELSLHWTLPGGGSGWAGALVARAALPTASGTFASTGVDLGAQALVGRRLGSRAEVSLGAGLVRFARREEDGILHPRHRGQGFLGLGLRLGSRWSILAQAAGSGRLVRNLARYPGFQVEGRLGARVRMGRAWSLEGGFSEGLAGIQAATDFGVFLGVTRRLAPRS
jgi:hypothetical protein